MVFRAGLGMVFPPVPLIKRLPGTYNRGFSEPLAQLSSSLPPFVHLPAVYVLASFVFECCSLVNQADLV